MLCSDFKREINTSSFDVFLYEKIKEIRKKILDREKIDKYFKEQEKKIKKRNKKI